jgi:hypothetical protein
MLRVLGGSVVADATLIGKRQSRRGCARECQGPAGLERLARYIARLPVAADRLTEVVPIRATGDPTRLPCGRDVDKPAMHVLMRPRYRPLASRTFDVRGCGAWTRNGSRTGDRGCWPGWFSSCWWASWFGCVDQYGTGSGRRSSG